MTDYDYQTDHWHENGSSNDSGWANYTFKCTVPVGCFLRYSVPLTVIYCIAYAVVLIVGVIGNCCALAVVFREKSLQSVYYRFMANLAVADLLVLLFCLPVTLLGNLFGPWILGLFMCKAVAYFQGVSVSASVNTLVAIAVDRFLAICYPMKHQITPSGCKIIITVIWLFSLTLIVPWAVFFKLRPIGWSGGSTLHVCREVWPSRSMDVVYFLVANLTLCYLLPLVVIIICYIFIWLRVRDRKIPGGNQGRSMENIVQKSKIKVIKMLLVIVIVFMFSWLPLYIIFAKIKVGVRYKDGSMEDFVIQVAAPLAQWLGASNSCINPILYAFFNSKFRAGFRRIFFGSSSRGENRDAKTAVVCEPCVCKLRMQRILVNGCDKVDTI